MRRVEFVGDDGFVEAHFEDLSAEAVVIATRAGGTGEMGRRGSGGSASVERVGSKGVPISSKISSVGGPEWVRKIKRWGLVV